MLLWSRASREGWQAERFRVSCCRGMGLPLRENEVRSGCWAVRSPKIVV